MSQRKTKLPKSMLLLSCLLLLLVCLVPSVQAAPVWVIETADSTSDVVSSATSLALDSNGDPHISYCNDPHDLLYAKKTGSSWTIETVDYLKVVGEDSSIALDAAGNPHITYVMSSPSTNISYVTKTGSGWHHETIAARGSLMYTSLKLDSSGSPHVVFLNNTDSVLKYATKLGGGWTIENVDTNVMSSNSLALDSSGNPHISYFDQTGRALKYATKTSTGWMIETVDDTGYSAGLYSGIAIDSYDNPHIAYYFTEGSTACLKYANKTATGWTTETVDNPGSGKNVGWYISLAIDSADRPHISYYDSYNDDLKYATNTGTTWTKTVVDSTGNVGMFNSIAIDSSNKPHISYFDWDHSYLKYASLCDRETISTATGTGIAALTTSVGEITSLTAVSEDSLPETGKPSMDFPHGFFSYNIEGLTPGQSVTVEITLPNNVPVGSQYWKYQNNQWIQIPIGSDNGDNVIYIVLTDGGLGDSDGLANGVISDPGGVAVNGGYFVVPETPFATALISMFAALSIFVLFKRQKQKSLLA
ncbi:MAG: hypothetical protein NWE92_11510 [Candidatus Bathyarchaeota archaeon]|nr:hypothetical protein [Candidatus Bathyarchaeota archaeon]